MATPHGPMDVERTVRDFIVKVNRAAKLGRFCNRHQGVIVGLAGRGRPHGAPVLGDRVNVMPHAVLVGKIRVGNDVMIGANSLVIWDIADHSVAVGVPARAISLQGRGIREGPTVPEEDPGVPAVPVPPPDRAP